MFCDDVCLLLDGLGSVDDGVECVLNRPAYDSLLAIFSHLYGPIGETFFADGWTQREDGSMVVSMEDFGQTFREKIMRAKFNGQ